MLFKNKYDCNRLIASSGKNQKSTGFIFNIFKKNFILVTLNMAQHTFLSALFSYYDNAIQI